ncbi:MAG: hypothetical protein HY721_29050 [Planctomycetes bacterium]|nr:hypothetical protein [Planctomycetota bacterium]
MPTRFQEFNTFSGERDVDGDGLPDALYIVPPTREIRLEHPGDLAEIVFYVFPSGTTPRQLAVAGNRVVYVLVSGTSPLNRTIYALKDNNGNGSARDPGDTVQTFLTPSTPIDAVLADAKTDESDAAGQVITLHTGGSPVRERLVLSTDSSVPLDGVVDAGAQITVTSSMLQSPKGLAVDSGSARVFVSGTPVADTTLTAVIFYEDTTGDKLVDGAYSQRFLDDLKTSENYDSLAFIPQNENSVTEPQDLLVMSHRPSGAGGGARIICARDSGQFYYAPTSETVFKDLLSPAVKIVDGFKKADGTVRAQVTYDDNWTVSEYDDTSQDCVSDVDLGDFASPDSALAEAQAADEKLPDPPDPPRTMCRVRFSPSISYQVLSPRLSDPGFPRLFDLGRRGVGGPGVCLGRSVQKDGT